MKTASAASLLCGTFPIKQPLPKRGDTAPGPGSFPGRSKSLTRSLGVRDGRERRFRLKINKPKIKRVPLRSDHLAFKTNERWRSGLIHASIDLLSSTTLNN